MTVEGKKELGYRVVLECIVCRLELRKIYLVVLPTFWGTRADRYVGVKLCFILKKSQSLWSLCLFWREYHFISWYSKFKDTRRVVPGAILAASCCIFSNSSFSYWAQLSQTTFPYSRISLTNVVYTISSYLRSSSYLSFLIVLILVQTLSLMFWIWWCQDPSLDKYKPAYVGVNFFDLLV